MDLPSLPTKTESNDKDRKAILIEVFYLIVSSLALAIIPFWLSSKSRDILRNLASQTGWFAPGESCGYTPFYWLSPAYVWLISWTILFAIIYFLSSKFIDKKTPRLRALKLSSIALISYLLFLVYMGQENASGKLNILELMLAILVIIAIIGLGIVVEVGVIAFTPLFIYNFIEAIISSLINSDFTPIDDLVKSSSVLFVIAFQLVFTYNEGKRINQGIETGSRIIRFLKLFLKQSWLLIILGVSWIIFWTLYFGSAAGYC